MISWIGLKRGVKRAMAKSHEPHFTQFNNGLLLEEDWRHFFSGCTADSVSETEMVRFKARGDIGHKAGIYYFVLFCFSIKAAIDSNEEYAV